MKVLIIEDEDLAANRLADLLAQSNTPFEVLDICDSVSSTLAWLDNNPDPDLLFLDIQLSDGHSFELFENRAINCPIIFTTAFDEYAIRAFKVNSVAYLLKPFKLIDIENAIEKYYRLQESLGVTEDIPNTLRALANQLQKTYKNRFFVKSRNKAYSVIVSNIPIFNYEDGAVLLYKNDGAKFLINYSLDELQKLLNPNIFFRINRKQIVNIEYIQQINTTIKGKLSVQIDCYGIDEALMVSKHRIAAFRKCLDK